MSPNEHRKVYQDLASICRILFVGYGEQTFMSKMVLSLSYAISDPAPLSKYRIMHLPNLVTTHIQRSLTRRCVLLGLLSAFIERSIIFIEVSNDDAVGHTGGVIHDVAFPETQV